MRHLLHPQWQLTYCGEDPWPKARRMQLTTTVALVTCPACYENLEIVTEIHTSEPDQWKTGEST